MEVAETHPVVHGNLSSAPWLSAKKHLKSHGALLYMDLELNLRLHWWLMNGTKLLQRYTVHCTLFSICKYHINSLECCFVGCFIILFGLATMVMGIACLLPKCKLQTDRVFTGGSLMNSKIDFRQKRLGRCPPFWHQKTSPGMTVFAVGIVMQEIKDWGFFREWT